MDDEWDIFTHANLMLAEAGSTVGVSQPVGVVLRPPDLVGKPEQVGSVSSPCAPYEDAAEYLKRKGR